MTANENSTLITGGAGFIGVNLVSSLAEGRAVRVLDDHSNPSPTNPGGARAEKVSGSILDGKALASALSGVSELVHLAAAGSVIESIRDPESNFKTNVAGTFAVLQAAAEKKLRRVVLASTGGALIGDAVPPVTERSLPKPISPYGASKLCGEAYCSAFAKAYGLGTICLRFGNVYGPHSIHKRGAVTTFIKALMRDEPIVIYGDGSASRDYIHVEDLCSGILAALESNLDGGEVLHLASGRETTVLQLAEMLRDVAGKPNHPIEFRSRRRGEVGRNFANYEKAEASLGFKPTWDLADGLTATWEWFVKNKSEVLEK